MQQVLCLDKMKQLPIKFIICTIIFLVGVLPLRSQIQVDTVSVLTYYIAGKTATGIRTTKIREPFIAISRDLLKTYPLHTYITLSECDWKGRYKVMDIMGKKHQRTIDIYIKGKKKNKQRCLCTKS